jgi:hypothetical protein
MFTANLNYCTFQLDVLRPSDGDPIGLRDFIVWERDECGAGGGQPAACAPVTIENGSFEIPVINPPWQHIDSDGSASTIPYWVGNVDVHRFPDLEVAPDGGSQIVDLNQNDPGSIEQKLTLVQGATYKLSFSHGVNYHCTGSASFEVVIGGVSRIFDSVSPIQRSYFMFTALEDDTQVRFNSLTGGCGAATIDDVTIECVDAPPAD